MTTHIVDMKGPLAGLEPHPENRKFTDESLARLVESIRVNGVIEPIQFRAIKEGRKKIRQILHGHRRARAAVLAGLEEAPMIEVGANDQEALTMVLVANMERDDLDVVEEADLLLAMAKLDMSPEEIARRLARDTKWVQLHLAIGVQPDPVKKALREKRMTVNTIAESMAVKEQHKAMAEQTLLRLAERSYPVDDAMARAEMRREIEKAEKAAAWETGKTARMEALKDMLAAHKWKFKLLHRRFDEPLDGNVDWSGVGDDLVEELEVHGVDAESIPAKHHGKKVGDLVTAYGGLSGLVVPKLGWHRDGEEYCTADAVVRVSLDKLVEVNNTLPEKDRWFESPKHIEADVDPEPVDWKEKHRIEREKRENRKSHVEFVIMQMAKAVREAEKYKLKEHFQRAYRQEWWEDCLAEFTNQYGETLFPDANGEDKVKARVAEFFDAPVIRENISLLMSLHYLFDDLSAARWYDTENDKLLAALDKFPACPAVDAAVAVVEKLKAGEL